MEDGFLEGVGVSVVDDRAGLVTDGLASSFGVLFAPFQRLWRMEHHIRRLLARGDVVTAAGLLGEPYEIEGRVVPGRSRGRVLGFPTANLLTTNEILPPGVFLTLASVGRRSYPSLTNIGVRPTFGDNPPGVETHLLDFEGDL